MNAELQQAAEALRWVAPSVTGPLAGLADPVAEWLDEAAGRPDIPDVALRVARAVNSGVGRPCICTEEAWPPHCPRHGIDA